MRTTAGAREERAGAYNARQTSSSGLFSACRLVTMVAALTSGGALRADPVQLVSYAPARDSVVLYLKDSSAIAARVPQDSLASRYDVVSKAADAAVPLPPTKPLPPRVDVVAALHEQAACETGALFDECPGFLDLLQRGQEAWPQFTEAVLPDDDAVLTTASFPRVASLADAISGSSETLPVAPVDRIDFRMGEVIMGAASVYNPYDQNDHDAGGARTASGELYNPIAWTAAIQIDLRDSFDGIRYGRLYQPRFALVELNGKRAIVKVNDVGPLRPGRVIDLSEQVMHYFDPSLRRGVLDGVLVTPLVGSNWTPGPLGTAPAPVMPAPPVTVASN